MATPPSPSTDAAPASAASPPPSPLPVLAEDATPGARATALQQAFAKALEATLNKCSYANFASCFPTPAQYRPQTLEMFHKDFTGRLSEVCSTEFNTIMKDRNVIALLNSLDRLIHEARLRKQAASSGEHNDPIPLHTLPPSALVNAHLASFLTDTTTSITTETARLEAQNAQLMEQIKRQRGEMEGLVAGLEGVLGDLERSAGMVQDGSVGELVAEVKMVEEELRG